MFFCCCVNSLLQINITLSILAPFNFTTVNHYLTLWKFNSETDGYALSKAGVYISYKSSQQPTYTTLIHPHTVFRILYVSTSRSLLLSLCSTDKFKQDVWGLKVNTSEFNSRANSKSEMSCVQLAMVTELAVVEWSVWNVCRHKPIHVNVTTNKNASSTSSSKQCILCCGKCAMRSNCKHTIFLWRIHRYALCTRKCHIRRTRLSCLYSVSI